MQNITLHSSVAILPVDSTGNLMIKTLLLGLATFMFFFLMIRTVDKRHYSKIRKAIRQNWEIIKHGNAVILVKDGVLQLDKLYKANITPQQVYAVLRLQNIYQLGDVERLFLIPGGEFSIYKKPDTNHGLPVLQYSGKVILNAQGEI